jgi:shikimate kinase
LSVWLDVPLPKLIQRLPADGRRPLAADRDQLERLYAMRGLAYQQAALRLDAGNTAVDGLVEQVLDAIVR